MPKEKRLSLSSKITSLLNNGFVTLKELQSLVGLLNFSSFVVPKGRLHYRALLDLLNVISKMPVAKLIPLPEKASEDLIWWLHNHHHPSLIHLAPPSISSRDASDLAWGRQAKAASRTVIASWVKSALAEAGIIASPGSIRSAVASKNWADNVPVDEILSRGNWRSGNTFRQFYRPHRRMRTVTNCFLVNLAVADLLMATLNGAPNFVFLVTAHWPFGTYTCKASNFTANLTVSAGVFTLVAITVDRYVAIVRPLQHRLSRTMARAALITVWCAGTLLSLPSLLYSDTYRKHYNLVFLAVTYVAPMLVMVWAYTRMSNALRGRAIGECTHHQMQVIRAKRKRRSEYLLIRTLFQVVRMFVLVVMVFALCWLPYHAYFVLVYHHQTLASAPFAQHIYLGFYWLAMANSMSHLHFDFNHFLFCVDRIFVSVLTDNN
ncbi:Neuropeptide receptor A33 [Operophtera brumata]|uniref:Neuropeptide receptor A33 n=1 Tax=Operophtera brumata TaxID=104452 RepID=A0A0L7LVC5_OPEBR|nr:Neuropeptide receptor A33 [Operophtera brumata]